MSTHATITVKCRDGKYRCVYVHFDGYFDVPGGVGYTLAKHYADQGKAEAVVALGALSSLGNTLWALPVPEYCKQSTVAYHRDRGETFMQGVGNTPEQAADKQPIGGADIVYLWDGEQWLVADADEGAKWTALAPLIPRR